MTAYPEPQRLSGPAELLQAIPYLLGFHPQRSLVLVGLAGGELAVTARLDLDVSSHPATLDHTVQTLRRGGSTDLIAALFDDDTDLRDIGRRWSGVAMDLDRAAHDFGCAITDVLAVGGGRWRSVYCRIDDCCPRDGRPIPTAPSAFAAAATVAGVVALPDRRALEQVLDPRPEHERAVLVPLLARAEPDFDADGAAGDAPVRAVRSVKRALFAAARGADEPEWAGPDDATAARFGAALRRPLLRDSLWLAVDDGRLDGRRLWRDLALRLPSPHDAAPLLLYGWASWRAGDGALAGIAAERAVLSDPDYTAADLLIAALSHGVDPRRLPRLRAPRAG